MILRIEYNDCMTTTDRINIAEGGELDYNELIVRMNKHRVSGATMARISVETMGGIEELSRVALPWYRSTAQRKLAEKRRILLSNISAHLRRPAK